MAMEAAYGLALYMEFDNWYYAQTMNIEEEEESKDGEMDGEMAEEEEMTESDEMFALFGF